MIVEVRKHRRTVVKSEETLGEGETFRDLLDLLSRKVPHEVKIGDSWKVLDGFCRRRLDEEVEVSPDKARMIRFIHETRAPEVPPEDPYLGFKPYTLYELGNGTIEYIRNPKHNLFPIHHPEEFFWNLVESRPPVEDWRNESSFWSNESRPPVEDMDWDVMD